MKNFLYRTGQINQLRRIQSSVRRDVRKWITQDGCSSIAPYVVKQQIIRAYLTKYNIKEFVETGTLNGETLVYIAKTGIQCTSIELDDQLYARALDLHGWRKNVRLLHGDSTDLIAGVINESVHPILFWLDGHYSGEGTGHGKIATPVSAELRAIIQHPCKQHIILIDDARCFDGTNGYPKLYDLLRYVEQETAYEAEVSCDIIRLSPRRVPV